MQLFNVYVQTLLANIDKTATDKERRRMMEIKMLKLSEVTPYDKNPRQNDGAVEYVANSIKEFGFKVPIVVDKDNVIVCGHTRYKAAQKLGLETVPTISAADLTPEQVKAYRLADNKVSEMAGWDFELLNDELAGIDFDMQDFGFADASGFTDDELESLMEKEVQERASKEKHIVTVSLATEEETEKCAAILTSNGYSPEVTNT